MIGENDAAKVDIPKMQRSELVGHLCLSRSSRVDGIQQRADSSDRQRFNLDSWDCFVAMQSSHRWNPCLIPSPKRFFSKNFSKSKSFTV